VTSTTPIELAIAALGARGDGIGEHEGRAIYVPCTVPGDRVLARLGERRGEGVAAELLRVIEPGPGRASPPCRHFGDCGGCAVQQLDDATYAEWKRALLVEALDRVGLDGSLVGPLVRIAPGTRRRASLGFVRRAQDAKLGFARRASHHLVDIDECAVLAPPLVALLAPLRAALAAALPSGASGEVVATLTATGIDLLLVTDAAPGLAARERLAAFAEARDLARLSWRRPGREAEPLARRRAPIVRAGGIDIEPPPGAFLQPSAEGEAVLAALVEQTIGAADPVADLYAGCGSFALALARTRRVHAVEDDADALAALNEAAARAGLGVTAERRDLARRPLYGPELERFAALVFDPPRVGAANQAKALAKFGPPLVVAVSCNPATLARDARILVDGGYRFMRATPVDQFLWSARLEAVAVFERVARPRPPG